MADTALKKLKFDKIFGGVVSKYEHVSSTLGGLPAKFNIFLPPACDQGKKVPVVVWLSGLTCSEDNFVQKAGAFRRAAELNIAVVCPDTSPRGAGITGEDDNWDFGTGAGFYVNATAEAWKKNYNMYDYVNSELNQLVKKNFPVLTDSFSITGHSMGGHGALVSYLKNPGLYKSCSAFAPICNPSNCPWGEKCFGNYLSDKSEWAAYDATELVKSFSGEKTEILIDQGADDDFLTKKQLLPEVFQKACADVKHPLNLRMQEGYNHSYFFISTFIDDHLDFHAKHLGLMTDN